MKHDPNIKVDKCSMECRVCFAPWAIPKNCRKPIAEVFRIWSSTDCYGRSLWTLIKLIKKKIGDNTMRWPKILFEALWAYCIFRNGARCIKPCRQVDEEQQARGHQVEVFIEWSKWYLAILICSRCSKMTISQEQLTGGAGKGTFLMFDKKPRVLSKQWPIHVSPLEQIWPMYTLPLVTR